MPRYFFDAEPDTMSADDIGTELKSLNHARMEAARLAGEMLKDYPDRFWQDNEWRIACRDETGLILFSLLVIATDAPAVAGAST